MISIYSNQTNIYDNPTNVYTSESQWWLIYDLNTKDINYGPLQCSGYTSSPLTMVVSDTKEELDQYIIDNGLIYPELSSGDY
jgi:hypothetical protein